MILIRHSCDRAEEHFSQPFTVLLAAAVGCSDSSLHGTSAEPTLRVKLRFEQPYNANTGKTAKNHFAMVVPSDTSVFNQWAGNGVPCPGHPAVSSSHDN